MHWRNGYLIKTKSHDLVIWFHLSAFLSLVLFLYGWAADSKQTVGQFILPGTQSRPWPPHVVDYTS